MSRIAHFELPADEPERAIKFYSEAFGWKFAKWDGPEEYWMITTGEGEEGINGGLLRTNEHFPPRTPINTIMVTDLDASVAKVTAAGGQIFMPKMAVPTIGWLAYFTDTEGVLFGMMQPDPNAA